MFFSLLLYFVVISMLILYRKNTIIDNKVKKNLKLSNVFIKA
jgi:hypothetical protein